jgi:hypothetical protein
VSITTSLDKLRLELGDTDVDNVLFEDDELNYFLSAENGDVMSACLRACEAAARHLARAFDFETDGQAFKRSQMAARFASLAKDLRSQGITTTGATSVSSVPVTRVDGYSDDIDAEQTSAAGTATPWQRFFVVGGLDRLD